MPYGACGQRSSAQISDMQRQAIDHKDEVRDKNAVHDLPSVLKDRGICGK